MNVSRYKIIFTLIDFKYIYRIINNITTNLNFKHPKEI